MSSRLCYVVPAGSYCNHTQVEPCAVGECAAPSAVVPCPPGFSCVTGSLVDINECASSPCVNGASCINGANAFLLSAFLDPRFGSSGVRVATTTANGPPALLLTPGSGSSSQVDTFDSQTLSLLNTYFAFDPIFRGGAFVGG